MRKYRANLIGLLCFIPILMTLGCLEISSSKAGDEKMKVLTIEWHRLVDDQGQTCDRCGSTESSVEKASKKLQRSLSEVGIAVVLEKKTLSPETFEKNPLDSNRIWVAGKPIEEWLSATSGQSRCCSACGDSDCRTVIVDGKIYEAIPEELIVKAGLLAGAQMISPDVPAPCCPPVPESKTNSGCGPGCTGSGC